MTHTKGTCEIEYDDYGDGGEGRPPEYLPVGLFVDRVQIACFKSLHEDGMDYDKEKIDIIEANARRLVALWNAANELDLDTGQIERGIIDDAFTALAEKVLVKEGESYMRGEMESHIKEMTS